MPTARPEGTTYGPSGTLGVVALLWSLIFGTATLSAATLAPAPAAAPQILMQPGAAQPPPSELPKVVAQLAAQPALSAADCATLARETISHGQAERQGGQPTKPGILHDGLAAVDQGEATDAKAADWPKLRAELQDLLKPPPPQDKPKEDEKKQDEKNEEQKQDEQKQQEQQKSQDQKPEQKPEQTKQEQQKQEQEKKQQGQQQQPDKPEPPKDTQSVGGEKPKDEERKEHPELAVPLQKLDQVRDKDSPAELFQLLHSDEPRPSDQPKKDW